MNLQRLLKLSILDKNSSLNDYERLILNMFLRLDKHLSFSNDNILMYDVILHSGKFPNFNRFRFIRFNKVYKICMLSYNRSIMAKFGFDNSIPDKVIQERWDNFLREYLNYELTTIMFIG